MKARVPLWNTPQKFVAVDTDATNGATLGVNLFNPDGSLVTLGQFHAGALAPFGIVGPMSVSVAGQPAKGNVSLTLVNDVADPGQLFGYGTNMAGAKGWYRPALFESTGLLSGGTLSINAGDNTKFDVSQAIVGYTDYSANPASPSRAVAAYGPTLANSVPNLAVTATYVGIQTPGLSLAMQSSPFTPTQRRTIVPLGAVISNGVNLIAVNNLPDVMRAGINQIQDFMEAVGPMNKSGNRITANGPNLQLNKSPGVVFKQGSNFVTNEEDPHNLALPGLTAFSFQYRLSNGTQYPSSPNVDPNNYEAPLGTLTAVPAANRFTIQRFSVFTSNLIRAQYGQNVYNTMAEAEAALSTESFVTEQNIAENGILLCFLIVQDGATSLLNPTQAKFIPASKFGGPVGTGGTSITNTDSLPEGTVNLYYTDERAQDAMAAAFAAGTQTGITFTYNDAAGSMSATVTGGGGGSLTLLGAVRVGADTGGLPVTDIDFSSLDIDAHGGTYLLDLFVVPNATGAKSIRLYYNGDTTDANYNIVFIGSDGGAAFGGGAASGEIGSDQPSAVTTPLSISAVIQHASGVHPVAFSNNTRFFNTSLGRGSYAHRRNSTANITSLKVRSTVANGFGVGSFCKLYRVN